MRKLVISFLWLLLAPPLILGAHINEIMYNPTGSDNNKEFVEILGTDNLSGYTIGDLAGNDSLGLIKFFSGDISLIVEEGFNHTNLNCSVYSAGATIGNNLNNDNDTVFLYYDNELVDFVGYDGSLANDNGYSLELIDNAWQESCEPGGSPGKGNCIKLNESVNETINETTNHTANQTQDNMSQENKTAAVKLEIIIPEKLFLGSVYDSLFKITNLNHTSGADNYVFVIVKYNITKNNSLVKEDYFNKTINYYSSSNTGYLFLEATGNYTLCGHIVNTSVNACKDFVVVNPLSIPCFIEINISTDKELYFDKEQVKIKNLINNKSFPFIIEYWVEDLFGEEIKKGYNTSNANQKTYTPKIVEKDRVFFVKNKLVFVACNNSNTELENEKMIIVMKKKSGAGTGGNGESSINIDHVYLPISKVLSFGSNFRVKLSIHKGDTAKSVVNIFVEKEGKKVSEETKVYLNKKNSDYNLTVMVLLKPNCENKLDEGECLLVVEGLDKRTDKDVSIEGNKKGVCKAEIIKEIGKITSFYTLSKKYNKQINLYANVNADETHALVLVSRNGGQNKIINSSEKVKFSVEPEPGLNMFVLELKKDKEVVDTKTLIVELEGGKKEESLEEFVLSEKNNLSEESNISFNYSLAPITSGVVYESSNIKIIKYVPYLLTLVLILVIVGLVVSKRR